MFDRHLGSPQAVFCARRILLSSFLMVDVEYGTAQKLYATPGRITVSIIFIFWVIEAGHCVRSLHCLMSFVVVMCVWIFHLSVGTTCIPRQTQASFWVSIGRDCPQQFMFAFCRVVLKAMGFFLIYWDNPLQHIFVLQRPSWTICRIYQFYLFVFEECLIYWIKLLNRLHRLPC